MTQNELVWVLLSLIQLGVVSFVGYWTRRVQRLEDILANTMETRTQMLIEYQGRLSRLEAQYTEIIKSLNRIERNVDNHMQGTRNNEEEN